MAKWNACYTEEEIVDISLGKIESSLQLQAYHRHVKQCPACRSMAEEWSLLLEKDVPTESEGQWFLTETSKERVKKRLWKELHQEKKNHKWDWLKSRPAAFLGIIASFALLFILINYSFHSAMDPFAMHRTEEKVNNDIDAHYTTYSIPVPHVDGYVWFNPVTEEIFIFVQGMHSSHDRDLQAWITQQNRLVDFGLLQINNGTGHLYKQGEELKKAETVRVSIEPKGGSLQPTGPDFFFIQLNNK